MSSSGGEAPREQEEKHGMSCFFVIVAMEGTMRIEITHLPSTYGATKVYRKNVKEVRDDEARQGQPEKYPSPSPRDQKEEKEKSLDLTA
jgi:hypothetical protein